VQYESIGRAAEALELTQPALSRQLRDLETDVGVALFTRTPRGVVPTLAGEALHADALIVLGAVERLASEAQRAVRGTAGDCVVGVVMSPLIWETVTRAVADCASRHPLVDVRIEDVPTPRQDRAIREARIDVGLCHRYPTVTDIDLSVARETLLPDALCMALVSRRHPLAGREDILLRELGDLPFLFMKRAFSPTLHDYVMSEFARGGYVPRIDGEYDGLPTVWTLAAQGMGWCVGSASQREAPPHGLVAVHVRDFHVPWGCELVYRRGETRQPVLSVIASLRHAATDVGASMASQENKYWSAGVVGG
jgi:DNA-binding transcriptional LysR family regulator